MSFFSRLFRRSKAPDKIVGGGPSLLALMLKGNIKVEPHACSICKNTAMIPASHWNFFSKVERQFTVDVGGYCRECKAHRCGAHTVFIVFPCSVWKSLNRGEEGQKEVMMAILEKDTTTVTLLGCCKCNTPYPLGSKEGADYVRAQAKRFHDMFGIITIA